MLMNKLLGALSLILGAIYFGWSDGRWSPLTGQVAMGCAAVSLWTLTGPTVTASVYRPHRIGAWVLRLFWGAAIATVPFQAWAATSTRWLCGLLGFAMAFSFIGRTYRLHAKQKWASVSEVVAVFGFALGVVLWNTTALPDLPLRSALFAVALTGSIVFLGLPTSAIQRSDVDHHRST